MIVIVDYKTGSARYPDLKQLKLMALMVFAHYPEVTRIKAGLLFVAHNMFIDEEYHRDQMNFLWEFFIAPLNRLRIAVDTDTWTPNPTPLCGWCPVTSCEYYRQR